MAGDLIPLGCHNCGAPVQVSRGARDATCRYCGQLFQIEAAPRPRAPATFDRRAVKVGEGGDFATLREALAAAEEGARILVGPGVYEERLVIFREVHLVAAEGPGTVTLRPPRKEIERIGERRQEAVFARREATEARDRHKGKLWRFGDAYNAELARLEAAVDAAQRALHEDTWALEAPLVRILAPTTLEGWKLESRGWDPRHPPRAVVEASRGASPLRLVDVELSEQSGLTLRGCDLDSDSHVSLERCSFRRFSAETTSAVTFAGLMVGEGSGSFSCSGCSFEQNFAGISLDGTGVFRVQDCTFRSHFVAILRLSEGVSLDECGNVFEGNRHDLGKRNRA